MQDIICGMKSPFNWMSARRGQLGLWEYPHMNMITQWDMFFDVCKDFRYFFYDEMEKLLS